MKEQVLLPKIFNFSFTYGTKKEKLTPGDIVEVPFGKEKAIGVVWPDKSFTPKKIKIKWPNDLLFEGRKIVGILMELSAEVDHIHHVIIGIGMDVNQTASEFPTSIRDVATSLKLASGKSCSS